MWRRPASEKPGAPDTRLLPESSIVWQDEQAATATSRPLDMGVSGEGSPIDAHPVRIKAQSVIPGPQATELHLMAVMSFRAFGKHSNHYK